MKLRYLIPILFTSLVLARTPQHAPQIWNDADLAEWATPLAALETRPGHFTPQEYYQVPGENLRTYPVYPPDREPAGYWESLQKLKPEPLVDASKMSSREDWIAAGMRAFRELDIATARTGDPATIARARDPETFRSSFTLPDGSVYDPRWVVTDKGVMLTAVDCSGCHVRMDANRNLVFAGPLDAWAARVPNARPAGLPITEFMERSFSALSLGEPFGIAMWRTVAVPWSPEERTDKLRYMMGAAELGRLVGGATGTVPRNNGSPFYGTRVPDLHVLRYSRYLDATGTHRLRGPEDVARYIALINGADSMDFGSHRMLTPAQRRVGSRLADEVLYAISLYLMSLEPPPNPNRAPQTMIDEGRRVFESQGCPACHAPPDYTTGKLTIVEGYRPPSTHPNRDDIMMASVGTNPGLALKTRKGTGFYKIPSLRGLWYRPFLLHDGSIAGLEELFDPARLSLDHLPGGWREPGTWRQPVSGHPFGLDLNEDEKRSLLAFLRGL